MTSQLDFAVEAIDVVKLDIADGDGLLAGHDLMSPYVLGSGGPQEADGPRAQEPARASNT